MQAHSEAIDLINSYRKGSDEAFATLVRRHIDFVYGVARRSVGDAHLAEDVTQTVFLLLARKAGRIGNDRQLPAWLFQTTRYVAGNALKSANRRQKHEKQAATREQAMISNDTTLSQSEIDPMLDQALAQLPAGERDLIIRRYFYDAGYGEIASEVGVSEQAARKRISRGLERLRTLLRVKGKPALSVAGVGAALAVAAGEKAPAAVVSTIVASGSGAAASAGSAGLLHQVTHALLISKLKIAATILLALTALGTGGAMIKVLAASYPVTPPPPPDSGAVVQDNAGAIAQPVADQPSRWVAQFPNGDKSELVAVGDPLTGQWWKPDGQPTTMDLKLEKFSDYIPNVDPHASYFYLVTTASHADPAVRMLNEHGPTEGFQYAYGTDVFSPSTGAYNLDIVKVDPGTKVISSSIKLASQPINSVLTLKQDAAGGWAASPKVEKTVESLGTFRISPPIVANANAHIDVEWPKVSSDAPESEYWIHVFLNDRNGQPFRTRQWRTVLNWAGPGKHAIETQGIKASAIGSVSIQMIHYDEWAKFRNVSLEPGVDHGVTVKTKVLTTSSAGSQVTFPSGDKNEFVAIGDPLTGQWWKPDGQPTEVDFTLARFHDYIPNPDPQVRYFYLATTASNGDGSPPRITSDPLKGYKTNYSISVVSASHGSYFVQIAQVDPKVTAISSSIKMASKSPTTVVSLTPDASGNWVASSSADALVKTLGKFRISNPMEVDGAAAFNVEWPQETEYTISMELRDGAGKMVYPGYSFSYGGDNKNLFKVTGLGLSSLGSVSLTLTRYDESARFQDISLEPGVDHNSTTESEVLQSADLQITHSDPGGR